MKLIYLWVKEFRNISKTGFKFSNSENIEFEYDSSTKATIKITPKPNSTSILFDKGVENITGILGKNSSGKSNLLELICMLSCGDNSFFWDDYLVVYSFGKNDYKVYTNILEAGRVSPNIEIFNEYNKIPDLSIIYFSNIVDGRTHVFPKGLIDLSENTQQNDTHKGGNRINSSEYHQFEFILSDYFERAELEESPSDIIFKTELNHKREYQDLFEKSKIYKHIQSQYNRALDVKNVSDHLRYSLRFSLFTWIFNELEYKILRRKDSFFEKKNRKQITSINELVEGLFGEFKYDETSIDLVHESVGDFINKTIIEFKTFGKLKSKTIAVLLKFDSIISKLNPSLIQEGNNNSYYKIKLNQENKKLLKSVVNIFNDDSILNIKWGGISSGSRAFLNIFAQLHSEYRRITAPKSPNNILICIDEGDLYLHPKWQKEFLQKLVNFIPQLYDNCNIQLILTSHSPFLASDLPREHLIFLENKNGLCTIVERSDEKSGKTFGTNLIDLFIETFSFDNGTISDFALTKIKKAIEIAKKDTKTKEEIKYATGIADLVGDEVISKKLKKILNQ